MHPELSVLLLHLDKNHKLYSCNATDQRQYKWHNTFSMQKDGSCPI